MSIIGFNFVKIPCQNSESQDSESQNSEKLIVKQLQRNNYSETLLAKKNRETIIANTKIANVRNIFYFILVTRVHQGDVGGVQPLWKKIFSEKISKGGKGKVYHPLDLLRNLRENFKGRPKDILT